MHSNDAYAPVAYLNLLSYHLEPKLDIPNIITYNIPSVLIPSLPQSEFTPKPHQDIDFRVVKQIDSYVYISETAIGVNYDSSLKSAQELRTIFTKIKGDLMYFLLFLTLQ
jgi:hypothetical protein